MTTEELNIQLYQKMAAEQSRYREYLLTLPPDEILKHAYEYATREDILLTMEHNDVGRRQATVLLKSDTPLEDVYHHHEQKGVGRTKDLLNSVEAKANAVIREDMKKDRQQERQVDPYGLCFSGTDCQGQRDGPADLPAVI